MIRSYKDSDYDQIRKLYQCTEWYGGVFDEARDGRERLKKVVEADPEAIVVYEENGKLRATISTIEDGRVAMPYRFVVAPGDAEIAKSLYEKASDTLSSRGHTQILVYSATNSLELDSRYISLGMNRGGDHACFWADI